MQQQKTRGEKLTSRLKVSPKKKTKSKTTAYVIK